MSTRPCVWALGLIGALGFSEQANGQCPGRISTEAFGYSCEFYHVRSPYLWVYYIPETCYLDIGPVRGVPDPPGSVAFQPHIVVGLDRIQFSMPCSPSCTPPGASCILWILPLVHHAPRFPQPPSFFFQVPPVLIGTTVLAQGALEWHFSAPGPTVFEMTQAVAITFLP